MVRGTQVILGVGLAGFWLVWGVGPSENPVRAWWAAGTAPGWSSPSPWPPRPRRQMRWAGKLPRRSCPSPWLNGTPPARLCRARAGRVAVRRPVYRPGLRTWSTAKTWQWWLRNMGGTMAPAFFQPMRGSRFRQTCYASVHVRSWTQRSPTRWDPGD